MVRVRSRRPAALTGLPDEHDVDRLGQLVPQGTARRRLGRRHRDHHPGWAAVHPDALSGLADFSHVEVVYLFDRVAPDTVQTGARHPSGNQAWPRVGIFAQRAKGWPNRLGVSVCELLTVNGLTLTVRDLDAIDGTPVLDVKPYMVEFAPRSPVRQPT